MFLLPPSPSPCLKEASSHLRIRRRGYLAGVEARDNLMKVVTDQRLLGQGEDIRGLGLFM
jgi:hypothetical protein